MFELLLTIVSTDHHLQGTFALQLFSEVVVAPSSTPFSTRYNPIQAWRADPQNVEISVFAHVDKDAELAEGGASSER